MQTGARSNPSRLSSLWNHEVPSLSIVVTTSNPTYLRWHTCTSIVSPSSLEHPYPEFIQNKTQRYYTSSWHLPTFLNPERSMSYSMEQHSKSAESSHQSMEYHSNTDGTELEEASTASDNDVFASIWYPSLPPVKNFPLCFPKPYLQNRDFKDSNQALRYIRRYFNPETIHKSLKFFPNLAKDFIYTNTYVDSHCFNSLQCYINKSIQDQDAAWLELHARYYSTSVINPYIVQCVL